MLKNSLTKQDFFWVENQKPVEVHTPVTVYFQLLEYYVGSPWERHAQAEVMLPLWE